MTASKVSITPFEVLPDLHIVWSGKLSCYGFRLNSGQYCLYSPIAGTSEKCADHFNPLGGVAALLAPNHYHNKGLVEHADRFPDAMAFASTTATPRLAKQTGLAAHPIDDLAKQMLPQMQILEPAGLKTGEVWIRIEHNQERIWLVTDAISADHLPVGEIAEHPKLLGTFPKFGVKDASAFRHWVSTEIARSAPTAILPCHGAPIRSANLGEAVALLLSELT